MYIGGGGGGGGAPMECLFVCYMPILEQAELFLYRATLKGLQRWGGCG